MPDLSLNKKKALVNRITRAIDLLYFLIFTHLGKIPVDSFKKYFAFFVEIVELNKIDP